PDSMADSWVGVMRTARTIWTISRFSASVFCASRAFSFSCCSAIFSRVLAISWSMRSILFFAIVKSLLLHKNCSPVHQAVALDALVGQGIALDLAGIAGIALHGVDFAAIGAHHNAYMVGAAVQ